MTVAPGLVYWEDFASAARQADVLVILYAPNRAMMSAVVRRVRQEDPDARIIPASAPDAPEITAAHFAEGICGYAPLGRHGCAHVAHPPGRGGFGRCPTYA